MSHYKHHNPVFKDEIIRVFCSDNPQQASYLCDCTFGGGGHTFSLMEQNPNLKVIAFDQDPDAIAHGLEKIKQRKIEKAGSIDSCKFFSTS